MKQTYLSKNQLAYLLNLNPEIYDSKQSMLKAWKFFLRENNSREHHGRLQEFAKAIKKRIEIL